MTARLIMLAATATVTLLPWLAATCAAQHTVAFAPTDFDREELLRSTAKIRSFTEEEVRALVPQQSGLNYVGCPNCRGGRQENQLSWSIDQPDKVTCRYCNHQFPSEQYPMNSSTRVHTPTGKPAEYPYWQNDAGIKFYFAAKRDDEVRRYMAQQARDLAALYQLTHDEAYARRASIILWRFAEVFPDWCYHYDYPFQQKQIYDGAVSPSQFRPGYRTARWTWWAYSDVPLELVQTYDWIAGSQALADLGNSLQIDLKNKIERQLIREACDQVIANSETHSNMSPRAWHGIATTGRVLGEPAYVHEVIRRLDQFLELKFFYDGIWCEGSPDYDSQSVRGLQRVLQTLEGYSDPVGYVDPVDGKHFEKLDLAGSFPAMQLAIDSLAKWRLPDGRSVPVHDTWPNSRHRPTTHTTPYLLPGVGHACLGSGQGRDQFQLHLAWSGGYGHSHGDNLSMLLFANERELLSDLGYTHSAYRAWTLATAAHNTVVIDGVNQSLGNSRQPTDGRLIDADLRTAKIQSVGADGSRGYPNLAKHYVRRLLVVQTSQGNPYVVDCFDVEGGTTHDYFLHGLADNDAHIESSLPLSARSSLLPAGLSFVPPQNEGQTSLISKPFYAYGFFNHLTAAPINDTNPLTVDFQADAHRNYASATVRVHLLPQAGSELIVGQNPSIRRADENDSKLDLYQRPFLMLRHATNGRSRFLSILDTFQSRPSIQKVEQLPHGQAIVLKVTLDSTTERSPMIDWIVMDAASPVTISSAAGALKFQGQLGYASVRGNQIETLVARGDSHWASEQGQLCRGSARSVSLSAISDNSFAIETNSGPAPEPGETLLMKTADGWHYPFTVKQVQAQSGFWRIEVQERLAFSYLPESQQLSGLMFPHRKHLGAVRLEWQTTATFAPR